ncbi:MAG: hypothetical protein KDI11_05670 [Alphaproteobacteria bacterium]|nr:hypothetical protein [Alphaproteobacteria bacterium]
MAELDNNQTTGPVPVNRAEIFMDPKFSIFSIKTDAYKNIPTTEFPQADLRVNQFIDANSTMIEASIRDTLTAEFKRRLEEAGPEANPQDIVDAFKARIARNIEIGRTDSEIKSGVSRPQTRINEMALARLEKMEASLVVENLHEKTQAAENAAQSTPAQPAAGRTLAGAVAEMRAASQRPEF